MTKKASTAKASKPAPKSKPATNPTPAATTADEMPEFLQRTPLVGSAPDPGAKAFVQTTRSAAPPPANVPTTPAPAPASDQTKPAAKAAPKQPAIKAKVLDTAVITVLSEKNPYKPNSGSHAAFNKYETGMTLAEAINAGIKRDWVLYDRRMKYIEIK